MIPAVRGQPNSQGRTVTRPRCVSLETYEEISGQLVVQPEKDDSNCGTAASSSAELSGAHARPVCASAASPGLN